MFSTYATNPQIGSPAEMYKLLKEAAHKRPVSGNQDGSYVTMKSNFALIFGVIQLCSGSGTVFLDQYVSAESMFLVFRLDFYP